MGKTGVLGALLSVAIAAGCGSSQDDTGARDQVSETYLKAVDDEDWKQVCSLYTPEHRKGLESSPTSPAKPCEQSERIARSLAESQGLRFRLSGRTEDLEFEGDEENDTAEVNVEGNDAIRLTMKKLDGEWLIEKASGLYARD